MIHKYSSKLHQQSAVYTTAAVVHATRIQQQYAAVRLIICRQSRRQYKNNICFFRRKYVAGAIALLFTCHPYIYIWVYYIYTAVLNLQIYSRTTEYYWEQKQCNGCTEPLICKNIYEDLCTYMLCTYTEYDHKYWCRTNVSYMTCAAAVCDVCIYVHYMQQQGLVIGNFGVKYPEINGQ